ncbi:MAG: 1,2-phenylacetyl-CoA epoxidase subunit PaaC [Granulosicoccus sp.]
MTPDQQPVIEFLCRLGDNTLILGQRLSEWCGRGPVLEEDIALANTALDLIGQTQLWLGLAGELEQAGRTADDLAMRRDVWDFHNFLLTEQPNGDFGQTMMRQFLFDAWHVRMLNGLSNASNEQIAEIAAKTVKEATYHLQRSSETVVGLGDGSDESHTRMQQALDKLWPYVGEMFAADDVDHAMQQNGVAPDLTQLQLDYHEYVNQVLSDATLELPDTCFSHSGGKDGSRHSEHLGHLLTQLQWLQRAYPGAKW